MVATEFGRDEEGSVEVARPLHNHQDIALITDTRKHSLPFGSRRPGLTIHSRCDAKLKGTPTVTSFAALP